VKGWENSKKEKVMIVAVYIAVFRRLQLANGTEAESCNCGKKGG
jgi:hypothetical protein